jgi:Flp pilus assembly protein TadG
MVVELVLFAPLLLVLMMFLVMAGRVVEAHDQVDGAARDAARAASLARTAASAQQAADQAVAADVNGGCSAPVLAGYAPGSQAVAVTLQCSLNLAFLGAGAVNVTGHAIAPLDQFVSRTY